MSDDEPESILSKLFAGFDEFISKMEKLPDQAKEKTERLLKLCYAKDKDIFKDPQEFLEALQDLNEQVGYAKDMVLEIELAKQKITPQTQIQDIMHLLAQRQGNVSPGQPLVIQPTAPNLGIISGYWYARAAKDIANAYMGKKDGEVDKPQITTSTRVTDILEFGRQLTPEFNNVHEYYHRALDRIYFFDDKETKERLRSELSKHLNKLAGIIRSFSRTLAEYRKELTSEKKRLVGEALVAMKLAEYNALGGMRVSDMVRNIRQQVGAQDAGS